MNSVLHLWNRLAFACVSFLFAMSVSAASLTTTFQGGNNQSGNMFDVSSSSPINISRFDVHAQGNSDYAIYYRAGTWVGHHDTPSDWTLLQTGSYTAQPFGTGTPIVLNTPLNLQANQTYSFYITSTSGSLLDYTNGNNVGNPYVADGVLTIFEGAGIGYAFGADGLYTPRIWNGTIYYSLGNVAPTAPTPVPTLGSWGAVLMSALLGLLCISWMRKRRNH